MIVSKIVIDIFFNPLSHINAPIALASIIVIVDHVRIVATSQNINHEKQDMMNDIRKSIKYNMFPSSFWSLYSDAEFATAQNIVDSISIAQSGIL